MTNKSKALTDALVKALELETEGRDFYLECAKKTKDPKGKEMFKYLEGEEVAHFERIEKLFRQEFNKEFTEFKDRYGKDIPPSGVFKKKVPGGSMDSKAGALDALNISLNAEENSILLYKKLEDEAHSENMKKVFQKLQKEEEKHLMIIKQAIDTMMETGAYHDFKIVTS